MPTSFPYVVRQVRSEETDLLRALLVVFGEAFEDQETYTGSVPDRGYHEALLGSETFIAIVALKSGTVVGGIAAYELSKFERRRKEIYLYDLAVAAAHRRQGVATSLIRELQTVARQRGAYVIFVQADRGDAPAIALYSKLGVREDVLHFDILPERGTSTDSAVRRVEGSGR